MANDVKWIKIVTDIFDDEKILLIESMPAADSILVIWFKLLTLAGKQNNNGVFMMSNRIAYTDEMLSTIFRRDLNLVRAALGVFEQFGMIEIVDNVITIPNWGKHQTLDAYERKKQRDRERVARKRAEQKALMARSPDGSPDMSPDGSPDQKSDVASLEGEEEGEEEGEKEGEEEGEKEGEREGEEKGEKENDTADNPPSHPRSYIPYELIRALYNETCVSLSQCRNISENRKKAIKARYSSGYTLEDFKTLFEKAESSSFLKGKNGRNWRASFDWLIKDANMTKVLEGNYDDHGKGGDNNGGPEKYPAGGQYGTYL